MEMFFIPGPRKITMGRSTKKYNTIKPSTFRISKLVKIFSVLFFAESEKGGRNCDRLLFFSFFPPPPPTCFMPTSLWEKTFRLGYEKKKKKTCRGGGGGDGGRKGKILTGSISFSSSSSHEGGGGRKALNHKPNQTAARRERGEGGFLQRGFGILFLFPPTVELASPGERRELARGPRRGFECLKNCTWLFLKKPAPHCVWEMEVSSPSGENSKGPPPPPWGNRSRSLSISFPR